MSAQAFHLKIISPSAVLVDDQVPTVQIPGSEGDFGVLPGHSPLFSMIRPGVINVVMADGQVRKFFATSGYADVTPDSCTVISDHIRSLSDVSPAEVETLQGEAKIAITKAETPAEREQAEKLQQVADALANAVKAH